VCGMSSTRIRLFIEGLGMKFVIFCIFLKFWTPNSQKRLAHVAPRGQIISRQLALAPRTRPRTRPRQRPGARSSVGESGAIPPALAPLSPGTSCVARGGSLACLSHTVGRQQRPLTHTASPISTNLNRPKYMCIELDSSAQVLICDAL
jgi:hypothetical protein